MIYKFFLKLFGATISTIILFTPIIINYDNNILMIKSKLKTPITKEIKELVENEFVFKIEYYCSIIINDKKTYYKRVIKSLKYKDYWFVNEKKVKIDEIQDEIGDFICEFKKINIKDNDEITVFIKAVILPDEKFEKSTGLKTRILWNHYVPRVKSKYIYKKGVFKIK